MAKIIPISEHFQHFLAEMKESFWGDLYGQTKLAWQRFFELQSERQRDRYSGWGRYERRRGRRRVYRNGYYERDFVTRFGTIRLRVARTREKSFLPRGLQPFQRRAEEVSLLIREAFLRGISTRQVGRVVATLTGEVVSAQTVSKLTRDLDEAVRQFHQAQLSDDYAYLFLDGVSLRVRRPAGRKRVQMVVAYGVRRGGATAGTGRTGVAVVLRRSPAPVAQAAHHQRDRALLRGSATENPTYGVLCERRKCGPHHLLHLPEIQSGMENPHPQPIYTSCLTSPPRGRI